MGKNNNSNPNTNPNTNPNPNTNTFPWKEIIGFLGVVLAAYIGFLGVRSQTEIPIKTTQTAIARLTESAPASTETPVPVAPTEIPALLRYIETFENNVARRDWTTTPFSDSELTVTRYIADEKYYHSTITSDESDGTWNTIEIPAANEVNFCLLFDIQAVDVPPNSQIYVFFRVNDYYSEEGNTSWHLIEFNEDGSGLIRSEPQGYNNVHDVGAFLYDKDAGFRFSDKETHTIKISVQGTKLEIYNGNTNALINQTILDGEGKLSEEGGFRIGTELPGQNQKMTVAIDNFFIYDKCQ